MLTPSGGLYQLTPYEGMRVTVASMTAVSGTNGSITSANEPTETATSTGYFYAVITGHRTALPRARHRYPRRPHPGRANRHRAVR